MCYFAVSSPAWDASEAMTLALPFHALALMAETYQLAVIVVLFSALPAILLAARVILVCTVAKLVEKSLSTG